METVVRMEGAVEVTLNKLVELGYFKTKSEVLRAGVLEIGQRYGVFRQAGEIEDELAALKVERIGREIDEGKRKVYSLDEVLKDADTRRRK